VRVAILGPAPPDRGGIAHETAQLAGELRSLASFEYLTFSRPYPRWADPRRFAIDPGLPSEEAVPMLDYLSPRSWRRTAHRLARSQSDAVIVPWWTSFWAIPVRAVFRYLNRERPQARRILLCHNVEDHEGRWGARWLTSGAFSAADAFIVHNEENGAELARRFPGRPLTVVPLPAPSIDADRQRARSVLGIQGRCVLFLGLVRRYKGVEVLLRAAPRIVHETGAQIAIIGEVFEDARHLDRLRLASSVRDRILWKDEYVAEQEMSLWLAACDVLVLPYWRISSSAIAARGIGALRPLAAAAVGGLKEVVEPGVTGELFAPGDADGLADAVARIFEKGAESYSSGLARAARATSWPIYARKILDFAESIQGAPPPGARQRS
jgi:glycosyltransferase involved in cell wall biosynthesis